MNSEKIDREAGIAADQGAIDAARALSARDCGALQSEMRVARQEYLAEAFAAHRRTAQAELVEALDNLLDLYTRWRRQFGATQGDIDSEVYVHDARATLSKYRTDGGV